MRVLFFGPPSVHLVRWRALAEQAGIDATFVSYDERHPDAVAHVDALPDGRLARLRALLRAARRVRRIVRELRPDVVHAHWLTGPGWIAALAGARPLVVTAWGSDALRWTPASRLARLLARLVTARAASLTYDAETVRVALAASGAHSGKLARIVIGADDRRFAPRPADVSLLERLGVPTGTPVVLSARGLDPVYRQEIVVEAFCLLARRRTVVLLLRAAPTDARLEPLLELASRRGVADSVLVYDGVADEELPALLASVDVAVSVPESDGTSVLLLETLLCETPVVVSDVPANREWVPAEADWHVPVGNADELAAALDRILGDLAGTRAIAAAAAERVRAEGTQERQRALIASLYERVAAAASTPPARE